MRRDYPDVTRVEVIDHRGGADGRSLVAYGATAFTDVQDQGRTLKIVISDHPTVSADDVRATVEKDLIAEIKAIQARRQARS